MEWPEDFSTRLQLRVSLTPSSKGSTHLLSCESEAPDVGVSGTSVGVSTYRDAVAEETVGINFNRSFISCSLTVGLKAGGVGGPVVLNSPSCRFLSRSC